MRRTKMKRAWHINNLPFIIHYSLDKGPDAFPTHSHGLTELGLPEFIMDPLAFGGKGNGYRINLSVEFFANAKNAHLLQEVLEGKVVQLTMADLSERNTDVRPYVYCYRLVPTTFEAVKSAYPNDWEDCPPETRFIQIWVKGDDFALMDEYYKGGIKF